MREIRILFFTLLFSASFLVSGQTVPTLEFNKEYKEITLSRSKNLSYKLPLTKDGIFVIAILQQGIAAAFELTDKDNHSVLKSPVPDDINGYLKKEYIPAVSGTFNLTIKAFEDPQNTEFGKLTIFIRSLSKDEITARTKIIKELEPENRKTVQTLDVDHFWEAFDNLKNCKTFSDSVNTFQKIYLDRATNGFIDFIRVRELTAEKFVKTVARYPRFYASIRKSSYEVKKAEPAIQGIFKKFKEIYPNFKPFKVCFAIGIANTGGAFSDQYVFIGSEIKTFGKDGDNSEFIKYKELAKAQTLSGDGDILQKIKSVVAHECVHTQQKPPANTQCMLLYNALNEGACDFISELVAENRINTATYQFGNKNEKQIWADFKNELCSNNTGNWFYNASTVKDKPADPGYYIGYKIVQEYYRNSTDKNQAIIDIIEVREPVKFLELSRYDQKIKQ